MTLRASPNHFLRSRSFHLSMVFPFPGPCLLTKSYHFFKSLPQMSPQKSFPVPFLPSSSTHRCLLWTQKCPHRYNGSRPVLQQNLLLVIFRHCSLSICFTRFEDRGMSLGNCKLLTHGLPTVESGQVFWGTFPNLSSWVLIRIKLTGGGWALFQSSWPFIPSCYKFRTS